MEFTTEAFSTFQTLTNRVGWMEQFVRNFEETRLLGDRAVSQNHMCLSKLRRFGNGEGEVREEQVGGGGGGEH